jgi:hypothetical protein
LSGAEALECLEELEPVKFKYKNEAGEGYVGFIAEDVPELVATGDHKSLSPMDIVAVLTKAMKEQQRQLEEQKKEIEVLKQRLNQN